MMSNDVQIIKKRLHEMLDSRKSFPIGEALLKELRARADDQHIPLSVLCNAVSKSTGVNADSTGRTIAIVMEIIQYLRGAEAQFLEEHYEIFDTEGNGRFLSKEEVRQAIRDKQNPETLEYDEQIMAKIFPFYQVRQRAKEALKSWGQ
jgi:hypothetical protein